MSRTHDTVPHSPAPSSGSGAGDAPRHAPGAITGEMGKVAEDVFMSELSFASLGLRSSVLKALEEQSYTKPTRIQAMLIPKILEGKDVLGQAKTGTGKTAAFALPILHKCDKSTSCQALVLVPTRELALQVAREINELGRHTPIRAVAVIGGQRINEQLKSLSMGSQIIVSTPGRLMDMVERGHVTLNNVKFAVLDEVDRMLDIGFRDDIRKILGKCPPPGQRQSIFVSATLPPDVEKLARSQSLDAEKVVAVTSGALTTSLVRQFYLPVQPWDRRKLLLHLLTHEDPALTVVFCRTKRTVDELARYLHDKGIDVHAMHGDMYQTKRNKVIERLHAGTLGVLVASDLASRGLDVDGITHVVNYDLPEDPEVYVHRIGRTARIGRDGVAWSFVMPDQGELLTKIELLINMEVPRLEYPDFVPSPPPPGRGGPGGPGGPGPSKPAQPAVSRIAATVAPTVPPVAKVDTTKFPGGIVPSKVPAKRMFGKMKTHRSMRDAAANPGATPATDATPGSTPNTAPPTAP
ncbi:MAG: DEAD/DEAH box helicase [Phycisphaerales bacterium]|jgi:ATP-dependent RNA helicase DeaD